jgi:hypothetical protein
VLLLLGQPLPPLPLPLLPLHMRLLLLLVPVLLPGFHAMTWGVMVLLLLLLLLVLPRGRPWEAQPSAAAAGIKEPADQTQMRWVGWGVGGGSVASGWAMWDVRYASSIAVSTNSICTGAAYD